MPEQRPPKKAPLNPKRTPIHENDPMERRGLFVEALIPYTREEAILEAQRCIQCGRPWCTDECPIHQDARGYIKLMAAEDFNGARDLILRDNPLASCLGDVCYHYCESVCPITKRGEAIAVRHLKRAAMMYADPAKPYAPVVPTNGMRVAVIGGGPAGLMNAWVLGQRGYDVTVFESSDRLGGLMTQTIPAYRLTDETFQEDMARFANLPVHFVFHAEFPKALDMDELLKEFDAVFVSIGTHKSRGLGIPGEDLDGVYSALSYLKESKRGERRSIRPRVVVIGGGDVAMDSARSAFRHGAQEVTVLYRRSREEMPADDQEIKEAMDEGVKFQFLVAPLKFLGTKRLEGVELQPMELGPPDESGRRRPMPAKTPPVTMGCDAAILAVSQEADLEVLPRDLEIKLAKDGTLQADPETGATKRSGVYAGGGASVVHAMAAGKRAALAMDAYMLAKKNRAS
ncbi:MAG TPA: FAD-dependent oxidoreductase [Thermoplasmata archaeon]|nr:FAD-dependent oxidoreductase [Thermoplasmata archaeon]